MKRNLLRILLLFFITVLSGCVPAKYIEGQNKVDRILAEPLKVTKLPISVKVTIDEKSRNIVVSSRAENAPVRIAHLPIGQQMVTSVNQVSDMPFEDTIGKGDYDADFYVEIKRFDFDWKVVMDTFPNDNAIHDMRLMVDSKLQNRNGPIIYQKLSDINMSGNGKFASFALAAKEVFERSKANIATLWAIDLMKDISQNKNVLEFAKARTSKLSAAIGPDILIPGHLNGMSTSDEFVQLTGKFKQRFL